MNAEQKAALIADCKTSIARIEKTLTHWQKSTYTLPYLESELARQKIALASLTAPKLTSVYQGIRGKQSVIGSEPLPLGATDVYATPPVMRSVKLPKVRLTSEFEDEFFDRRIYLKDELIATLREAGIQIEGEE